jgi:hypothetical protein
MPRFEEATPTRVKVHNYAVRGMGSVQFLHLPCPAAHGQFWKWVCPQDANVSVPGFGLTMGDTFRIDRCIDGPEPDREKHEFGKTYRTCEVTFVGNRNSDPEVPDATGLLEYSF